MRSSLRTPLVSELFVLASLVFSLALVSSPSIVHGQNPDYELVVADALVPAGSTFTLDVVLDSLDGAPLRGWSYGVCHDANALTIESVETGPMVVELTGSSIFFESFRLLPDGYTVGVVVNSPPTLTLPPTFGPLTIGTYSHSLVPGEATTVSICETLNTPPVEIVMVTNTSSNELPVTVQGTVTAIEDYPWIRGDANDDGLVNLADGVFLLNELFQGGPAGTCFGAKDANSDETVDAADAIYLFSALFFDGPPPAAPFPDCGSMPSAPTDVCSFQTSCL